MKTTFAYSINTKGSSLSFQMLSFLQIMECIGPKKLLENQFPEKNVLFKI